MRQHVKRTTSHLTCEEYGVPVCEMENSRKNQYVQCCVLQRCKIQITVMAVVGKRSMAGENYMGGRMGAVFHYESDCLGIETGRDCTSFLRAAGGTYSVDFTINQHMLYMTQLS